MSRDQILAIDNGTQSVRALLFDPRGELIAKSRVPIEPYFSTAPGLAEQRPEVFWEALCRACQALWETPGVSKESVAGVALTTQRSTVINLDREGKPLRTAIVWLDQRRTEGLAPVGGLWGLAFRLAGMSGTVAYLQAEAEANWIRRHQPEIWDQTHKYLFLSGYLTYRLTGRLADSIGRVVEQRVADELRRRPAASPKGRGPQKRVARRARGAEIMRWVADRRARRVPIFVIEMTGSPRRRGPHAQHYPFPPSPTRV